MNKNWAGEGQEKNILSRGNRSNEGLDTDSM
jgi:hypothetical protein